jgi:AhpD family alkylhydroperoxidase
MNTLAKDNSKAPNRSTRAHAGARAPGHWRRSAVLPLTALAVAATAASAPTARAANAEVEATLADIKAHTGGFVPAHLKALPEAALPGVWSEVKALQVSLKTALPCKVKEIIGIAVGSQLPSRALVDGHGALAKASGATSAEIGEGVALAAMARHWSTFFNGAQLDLNKFKGEIGKLVAGAKAAAASGAAPPKPMAITDAKSALDDMKQSFGFVPEFASRFPASALPGAWRQMRDLEMNPSTALSGKYKSLIGVAVSSQIPCAYCIAADTEFAKLEGATDQEITEAIAMAGLVRQEAATLTGFGIDDATFRKEMERIAHFVTQQMSKAASAGAGDKRQMTATAHK